MPLAGYNTAEDVCDTSNVNKPVWHTGACRGDGGDGLYKLFRAAADQQPPEGGLAEGPAPPVPLPKPLALPPPLPPLPPPPPRLLGPGSDTPRAAPRRLWPVAEGSRRKHASYIRLNRDGQAAETAQYGRNPAERIVAVPQNAAFPALSHIFELSCLCWAV